MMKTTPWWSLCWLLGLLALPLHAQETAWDGALYVESAFGSAQPSAELQIITETGVRMGLPVPLSALRPAGYRTAAVALSPDRRYLALSARPDDFNQQPTLRIADLSAGTCCLSVQVNAVDFLLGAFDPTSTQLAFSYVGASADDQMSFADGGLGVVNAASGQVTTVPMGQVRAAIGAPDFAAWAVMGAWMPQGVEFAPTCYACDGIFEETYALWNPTTGQFVANSPRIFSIFGAHLGTSSAFLFIAQDDAFPISFEAGMLPPANVVKYAATGDQTAATTVYFTPESLDIGRALWVDDGNAFLVAHFGGDFWDVVRRDGAQFRIKGVRDLRFLAGTPTGWLAELALEGAATQIYHYDGETMQSQLIASVPAGNRVEVVQMPPLGAGVAQASAFPPVAPPSPAAAATIQANNAVTCLGLRSRIYPGDLGRVTPGAPNRFREGPSADSPIIGEIPGEAIFTAAGAAFCDAATGILWLPVEYQGQFGWTAEGQGGAYYTEPLP